MTDNNAESLNAWNAHTEVSPVTLQLMDETVAQLKIKRDEYDVQAEALKAIGKEVDELTDKVIAMLQANGKTSYKLDGVVGVSLSMRQSYKVPTAGDDKQRLFNYIEKKYGYEGLLSLQSINSQTLNAWAKKEFEAGVMSIDGLSQPTITPTLSVRKA